MPDTIKFNLLENGPVVVETKTGVVAVCRCGKSSDPHILCDGTHKKINFIASVSQLEVSEDETEEIVYSNDEVSKLGCCNDDKQEGCCKDQ